MKLGQNLIKTFLDYYKLTGYINIKPTENLDSKQQQSRETRREFHFPIARATSEPVREDNKYD